MTLKQNSDRVIVIGSKGKETAPKFCDAGDKADQKTWGMFTFLKIRYMAVNLPPNVPLLLKCS